MEQDTAYEVLWQKKADETAEIVRVYGQTAQVILPQRIEGYTVTGITPYCFSDKEVLPEKGQLHRTRYTAADNFKRTDADARTNPDCVSEPDTGVNPDFVSDSDTGIKIDFVSDSDAGIADCVRQSVRRDHVPGIAGRNRQFCFL